MERTNRWVIKLLGERTKRGVIELQMERTNEWERTKRQSDKTASGKDKEMGAYESSIGYFGSFG